MVRRSVRTLRTASWGWLTGRRTKPTSMRPAIKASIWSRVDISATSISTPGRASRNFSRARGTKLSTVDMPTPSRSLPSSPLVAAARSFKGNIQVADDPAALFVEHGSCGSERNSAPVADQKRSANFFFETLDALAQRRLRNVQAGGRPAEMQQFGKDCERGQVTSFQLHTPKLSQASNHFIGRIAAPGFLLSIYE